MACLIVPPPRRQRAGGWRGAHTSIHVVASVVEHVGGDGNEASGVKGLVGLSSSVNAESDLIINAATTLLAFVRQHPRVLLNTRGAGKGTLGLNVASWSHEAWLEPNP